MPRIVRPVVLIVVAAVAGFLIARTAESGHKSDPSALTRTARAATFDVHYPAAWTEGDPAPLPGLRLAGAIGLRPHDAGGEGLTIGTARATAVGALPATFLASLPHAPRSQTVALGGIDWDRYLNLRPRGGTGVISVYLLATTRVTIVAACSASRPDGTFTAGCERILRTLRLAPGVKISGGVDAAYALELNQILSTLNRARQANAKALLAPSLAGRAIAADRLAGAQAKAAIAADRLSAGSAAAANTALAGALQQAASGYRALAQAARRHDRAGYEAAQRTLQSAQKTLQGAFQTLSALGYQLR